MIEKASSYTSYFSKPQTRGLDFSTVETSYNTSHASENKVIRGQIELALSKHLLHAKVRGVIRSSHLAYSGGNEKVPLVGQFVGVANGSSYYGMLETTKRDFSSCLTLRPHKQYRKHMVTPLADGICIMYLSRTQ